MTHLKLYLDDVRPCPDGWALARSVFDAKLLIVSHMSIAGNTFEVSLDHDLGEYEGKEEPNGCVLVRWMASAGVFPTRAAIHSDNPVGRKNLKFDIAAMERQRDS